MTSSSSSLLSSSLSKLCQLSRILLDAKKGVVGGGSIAERLEIELPGVVGGGPIVERLELELPLEFFFLHPFFYYFAKHLLLIAFHKYYYQQSPQ